MLQQLAAAHHPSEPDDRTEREPAERMARDLDQVDAHAPTGDELIALSDALLELPEGFTVHPKLGSAARAAPQRPSARAASTGATPSRSHSARCWPTASRSA